MPGSPAAPCQLLSLHPAGAGCYKAAHHAARRQRRAFIRVPQAQHPHKHTPRPLLFAVPRTQRALGADAAAPGLHHGPQGDAGLASVKSAKFSPSSTKKPGGEKPGVSTFFSEKAAPGTRGREPKLAREEGPERKKPTAFKTGTKVQHKCPKPFVINAVRGVCKAPNFQLLQGTLLKHNPTTTR